ncbi:hypothetical protein [Desulfosporosinus nitroreducens]|uniref:hypothetical protein n=1 Tax=Desulfosporosinus nitroreducens TaxID=2018668 RepID=UPI00207C22FA|nr:hypothetical protein [Desulfosporosinus nitroreducens]MCO1600178.1 hypothetical protein [Desulfosporosinus nitroreducens]
MRVKYTEAMGGMSQITSFAYDELRRMTSESQVQAMGILKVSGFIITISYSASAVIPGGKPFGKVVNKRVSSAVNVSSEWFAQN